MRQVGLNSILGKLGIWGVYLLFLSVQLNLKYAFPDSGFTTIYCSGSHIKASKDAKPLIQKLRLNKRYERGQVYQVTSQPPLVFAVFRVVYDQPISCDLAIPTPGLATSYLRGPPAAFMLTV